MAATAAATDIAEIVMDISSEEEGEGKEEESGIQVMQVSRPSVVGGHLHHPATTPPSSTSKDFEMAWRLVQQEAGVVEIIDTTSSTAQPATTTTTTTTTGQKTYFGSRSLPSPPPTLSSTPSSSPRASSAAAAAAIVLTPDTPRTRARSAQERRDAAFALRLAAEEEEIAANGVVAASSSPATAASAAAAAVQVGRHGGKGKTAVRSAKRLAKSGKARSSSRVVNAAAHVAAAAAAAAAAQEAADAEYARRLAAEDEMAMSRAALAWQMEMDARDSTYVVGNSYGDGGRSRGRGRGRGGARGQARGRGRSHGGGGGRYSYHTSGFAAEAAAASEDIGDSYEELLALDDSVKNPGLSADILLTRTTVQVLDAKAVTQRSDDNCVICLEPYKVGDRIRRLPCLCCFHESCVDRYFEEAKICPVCRTDVCT